MNGLNRWTKIGWTEDSVLDHAYRQPRLLTWKPTDNTLQRIREMVGGVLSTSQDVLHHRRPFAAFVDVKTMMVPSGSITSIEWSSLLTFSPRSSRSLAATERLATTKTILLSHLRQSRGLSACLVDLMYASEVACLEADVHQASWLGVTGPRIEFNELAIAYLLNR